MDMICSTCHRLGMYWKNLGGLSPWTYCPHCDGPRLPIPEELEEEAATDDEAEEAENGVD